MEQGREKAGKKVEKGRRSAGRAAWRSPTPCDLSPVTYPLFFRQHFDDGFENAGVVGQCAFVDRQKEQAIAGGREFRSPTDEDEVIVISADYADQCAGRLIRHQLFRVGQLKPFGAAVLSAGRIKR